MLIVEAKLVRNIGTVFKFKLKKCNQCSAFRQRDFYPRKAFLLTSRPRSRLTFVSPERELLIDVDIQPMMRSKFFDN